MTDIGFSLEAEPTGVFGGHWIWRALDGRKNMVSQCHRSPTSSMNWDSSLSCSGPSSRTPDSLSFAAPLPSLCRRAASLFGPRFFSYLDALFLGDVYHRVKGKVL